MRSHDLLDRGVRAYNALIERRRRPPADAPDPDLRAIRARAAFGTDISSHLEALYVAGLAAHPRLIVELGVRGGESTFVFERVARRAGADLVSVDIADCSAVSRYERRTGCRTTTCAWGGGFGTGASSAASSHWSTC